MGLSAKEIERIKEEEKVRWEARQELKAAGGGCGCGGHSGHWRCRWWVWVVVIVLAWAGMRMFCGRHCGMGMGMGWPCKAKAMGQMDPAHCRGMMMQDQEDADEKAVPAPAKPAAPAVKK